MKFVNLRLAQIVATLTCMGMGGLTMVAHAQGTPLKEFSYQVPVTGYNGAELTSGVLKLSPAAHDFGVVVLGSAASTTTTLKNTGQNAVSLTGFNLPAPFSQTNGCPSVLVGGASCTLTVTYTPSGAGTHDGALAVQADPADAATSFALTGTAVVPTSTLLLSLNTVDFGDSNVGTPAANKSVRITNTGNSPATINGIGISGGTAEFNQSNNCAQLAPSAFCTVSLSFVPSAYGSRSANLTIYEEAASALYSVALNGSGNAAVMSLSPGALTFPSAIADYGSSSAQVSVYNNGNLPLTGLSFDTSSPSEYTVTGNTCTASLPANGSCLVTVRFAPAAAGARTATFTAFSTNSGSATVSMSGTGIAQAPAVSASVPSMAFNVVPVDGSSESQSVTYTNTGNVTVSRGALSLSTGAASYVSSTTCGSTLAVNATCTASVIFSPRTAGAHPGNLRAAFSSGDINTALSGTGTLGEATVSPATVSFADQQVASTSSANAVTVTNSGNRKLIFSGVSIITGATDFAQSNNCAEVAPAGTCTVNVTFTPSASGPLAGTLTLMHDGVNGTTTVDLDGTGRSQSATLSTPSFATTSVGSSSTGTATLSNTGIGTLSATPPAAGSVTGADYSFVSTTCGTSVAVGSSCTTTIRFSPASTTPASGTLNIATGAGDQSAGFGSTGIQGFATVNPSSLSFASQQVGSTSTSQAVTVTNTGSDTLTFTGVGISAGIADYGQNNNCGSVAVGATCTVNVAFTPSTTGSRPGTLSFTHNGGGIATVNLAGTGQAPSASTSAVSFGNVVVGSSPTGTSTLTNTGVGSITVTAPTTASVTGTDFSFVSTTCGGTLAPGATCATSVRFSPTNNVPRSGVLSINAGAAGTVTGSLSGTGIQGTASYSATTLTYTAQQTGTSSAAQTVTVTNAGTSTLTISSVSVSAGAADFGQTGTCSGATLAVNGTCAINVTFTPSAAGTRTGTVTITSNSSNGNGSISLSGTGQAQSASLSTPSFSSTPVGSSSTATATLTNTGIGNLTVTPPTTGSVTGAAYSFVSTTCGTSLSASGTCSTTVRFSPANTSAQSGTLAIATSAGNQSVTLGSTGIQGFASMSPGSLTFSMTTVGASASAQSITVTNTGTNTLTFTGVGIASGSTDFGQSNNCGSVPVNGTCTVNVSFTPSTTGTRNGSVGFTHNGGGVAVVNLTGTGASYSWVSGSWSTPAACGATTSTRTVSCQRNDGTTVVDGMCSGAKPATTQAATDYSSCSYTFQYSGWSTPASCGNVTQTRTASCQRSDGTTVDNSYCGTPVTSQPATDYSTCSYSFQYGGWNTPAGCGTVTQTRTASCQRSDGTTVANSYCGTPVTSQSTTNYSTCTYAWQSGSYSTPAACGATTATRSVWCQRSDGTTVTDANCSGAKPASSQATTDYSACSYTWQTGSYSTPSGCGTVTATRSVWCQRSDGTTVSDASCGGGKPASSTSTTNYSSCTYSFSYGAWSNPSGCGTVTQTRTASCQRSDGATVSNSYCGTPVTSQSSTNYSSCTYSFSYGAWSNPSGCGTVTQTRTASCQRSDGTTVSDSYCGTPVTSQSATSYSSCTYSANLGGWSACSNSCGTGTQSRSVSCTRSDGSTVANSNCGSPATSQSCTGSSGCCPEPYNFCNYGNDSQNGDPHDDYYEWGTVTYSGPSCTPSVYSTRGNECPPGY